MDGPRGPYAKWDKLTKTNTGWYHIYVEYNAKAIQYNTKAYNKMETKQKEADSQTQRTN